MSKRYRYRRGELEALGGFVAIPYDVLLSNDYKSLSVEAKALLLEVTGQYRGNNNGDLTPSFYVVGKTLGWGRTRHVKAVAEVRATRLIQVTAEPRKGSNGRPELWALSWFGLNYKSKFDLLPQDFKRFLYRDLPEIDPNAKLNAQARQLVKRSLRAAGKAA